MILILLLLLPVTSGSVIGQTSGFVGDNVLLPCNCTDDFKDLLWQREQQIVNAHSEDEIKIDTFYINRTQLFLKNTRNCSLLLLKISMEDAGVYTCYSISEMQDFFIKNEFKVNLTVSQREDWEITGQNATQTGGESDTAVSICVPILVLVAILAALLLTLMIRKRHRKHIDTDPRAQEHMLEQV